MSGGGGFDELVGAVAERAASHVAEKILAGLEDKIATAVNNAIRGNTADVYLDTKQLGKRFGISRRAMAARLKNGSELAVLARVVDGRKVWLRSDVDALLARQK